MFRLQRVEGEPIVVGGATVTPVARRIAIGAGWRSGAVWFVHDGPAHVRVDTDQDTSRIRVPDVTLMARLALVAVTVLALFLRRRS